MTTQELRELFLKEHRRDRRLTLINYGIICFIALLFLGLMAFLFKAAHINALDSFSKTFEGGEHDPWYIKYVFIAVLVGIVLYPFYHVWKLSKRPQKIEELMSKIESGSKASTVDDIEEYKVTIPFVKVNFKLCPVTSAIIHLDNDIKLYQLPIDSSYLPEMKILLSGGNMAKLAEIKHELYADDENNIVAAATPSVNDVSVEEVVEKPTPLKSTDEFRAFLDKDLNDTIKEIDKQRSSTQRMTMIVVPLVLLVVLGIGGYYCYSTFKAAEAGDYTSPGSSIPILILFFGVITVIGFGYSYFVRKKHEKSVNAQAASNSDVDAVAAGGSLNETVFRRIIKFINPTAEYIPIGHIGLPEFLESGLYQGKNYGIDGNDQISGRHNGVPFIMCELQVSYKRNFSDVKDSPDSVLSGLFFVAKFNKKFSSPVYIIPRKGASGYTNLVGEKVKLEDPEFMDMFEVYSPDQVEARYILTPSTMERIKNIARRNKGKFYVAFNNNKITITNDNNDTKFGVGFFDSLTKNDNKLLVDFYETIRDQMSIIDELKLNMKIWK